MLRTTNPQRSLWEAILPAEALGLPSELVTVDRLLDDPAFIQPFRVHFDPIIGRPSIPIETYLRLMFLRFRYRLGYELLCREVADSISWQRLCRIPLGGQVPHPTTLVKLTRRVGEQTVDGLNQALLARAAQRKLLRTHKVRADTTVIGANVAYPTDLGLLARAVDKLASTAKRVQAAGGATRTRIRDSRRAARRRAHQVAQAMRSRTDQAKQVVFEVTRQVARLAQAQLADASARFRRAGFAHRGATRPEPPSAPPPAWARICCCGRSAEGHRPLARQPRPPNIWPVWSGPGDVVGLHDGIGRGTFDPDGAPARRPRARRRVELAALPSALQRLQARGIRLITASELVEATPQATA